MVLENLYTNVAAKIQALPSLMDASQTAYVDKQSTTASKSPYYEEDVFKVHGIKIVMVMLSGLKQVIVF